MFLMLLKIDLDNDEDVKYISQSNIQQHKVLNIDLNDIMEIKLINYASTKHDNFILLRQYIAAEV